MQPSRSQPRAPGSFSPLPGAATAAAAAGSMPASQGLPVPSPRAPPLRRVDSSDSDDSTLLPPISITKARQRGSSANSPVTPVFHQPQAPFTNHANSSSSSLHHNFSRPNGSSSAAAARSVTQGSSSPMLKGHHHTRKHSATPGLFDSSLPSASASNLSLVGMASTSNQATPPPALTASQIAAQAAVMSHQHHSRHRSQTVPFPGEPNEPPRRGSASRGPLSPPMLSLTEASAPRDNGFGSQSHDRFVGSHSSAATAAANVVFPRSGRSSPNQPTSTSPLPHQQAPPIPPPLPEKSSRSEKPKVKLFSRPSKISTKGETRDKPLPSPGKIGSALSALQRHNFSTSSLVEPTAPSLYNLNNSSSATIRPIDMAGEDKGKEKEKKHHFLSRQKNKLKDEYHFALSSASSNSRPTDPNAPNSLYNFNIPSSPGPNSGFAKAKKDKKYGERSDSRLDSESSFNVQGDWPGPSSLPSMSQSSMYDPVDPGRLGLHMHMSMDDAWPYLKAKLLVIFEGEDLRIPVEDFNRVAQMHIQYCIHKRSPTAMLDDIRDLLSSGFSYLDQTLRKTPEDRFIPTLVELWLFTFTSILPYMQSVFLPLDLEVSGSGTLMNAEQARDFWGAVVSSSPSSSSDRGPRIDPASTVLDVRRLVLKAYRDIIILPRYDTLKTIFSRLSLEFLPSSFNAALSSPPSDLILSTSPSESFSSVARPGTAMSLDPSVASYNSSTTTLLNEGSTGGRSRAISNVSFGSHGSVREQNVEDSKQVTDMVGRMLQCMSVLSSLGGVGGDHDEGNRKVVELCKMLKLNWLGRGRTGRNRRGIVGGRVKREEVREELRVA
ncbi:HbrB-like-domain-containing protein [Stachybotrys elegans]|uniref:HbrB-like-domain-containing protein n=1 Tax=Stachybotrys elegans TaxID=80388 RepID=A0A8K0SQ40_9HYPO|nr:HbrB-like-domain-containing protein [Stachybotrys elegans]